LEIERLEATGQNTQFDLGHWVLRLIAAFIDGIILTIIAWILLAILLVPLIFIGAFAGFWAVYGTLLVIPFAGGILWFIYAVIIESSWSATLGKRILGLRVQTVNGGRPNINQLVLRNISKIFWLFLLLDWLIGVATPGDRRQKYMDRVAGTTVVQTSQPFASVSPPPPPPPPPS